MNSVATTIFVVLIALVTVLGFFATRFRSGDLSLLTEWGLGGRRFGTVLTWFLLGGDLYTAYTFIAVPALVFGKGAIGFFAVPYTIIVYPLVYAVFPRLWSVAHAKNYVTAADFVRGRFGSSMLALAVALTGVIATMPYIGLQLIGMEVVIASVGLPTKLLIGTLGISHLPLLVAFVALGAYTYVSGLRAPAMIAVVKDLLIYGTVIAAVIVIPIELGGYGKIFAAVSTKSLLLAPATASNLGPQSAYATQALGSALALFLYPHAITGVLSASSRHVIRRNAVALPAYSLALGLIALLGYMAVAAGVKGSPAFAGGFRTFNDNFAVPALFLKMFPSWFVGVAFAAIAIGALVPAAIMSIACANLFTRNIWREYVERECAPAREARVAKTASIVVAFGGLFFAIGLPVQYAIQLQLLGGVWIIQTLPSVLLGLYFRKLHPYALLIGWLSGIAVGTDMAWTKAGVATTYVLHIFGVAIPCYAALSSLALNLLVSFVLTLVLNALPGGVRTDATAAEDYVS